MIAREKWYSALHASFLSWAVRSCMQASVGFVGCEGSGCSPDSPEADQGCMLGAAGRTWPFSENGDRSKFGSRDLA